MSDQNFDSFCDPVSCPFSHCFPKQQPPGLLIAIVFSLQGLVLAVLQKSKGFSTVFVSAEMPSTLEGLLDHSSCSSPENSLSSYLAFFFRTLANKVIMYSFPFSQSVCLSSVYQHIRALANLQHGIYHQFLE